MNFPRLSSKKIYKEKTYFKNFPKNANQVDIQTETKTFNFASKLLQDKLTQSGCKNAKNKVEDAQTNDRAPLVSSMKFTIFKSEDSPIVQKILEETNYVGSYEICVNRSGPAAAA